MRRDRHAVAWYASRPVMLALAVAVASWVWGPPVAGQGAYVPERVFASAKKAFADFEVLLADVARADVVFVGEEHDDPNTHRLELHILEGLAARRGDVVLSFEMFERDVQEPLGHFLMGHTSEAEFLQESRPWPRYATDYKPLMDFAIGRNWAVVAANVPRTLATDVTKGGFDALNARPEAEKAWFAADRRCPTNDQYFKRFQSAMGGHEAGTAGSSLSTASLERYYQAQCLKDETMGESIAQAHAAGSIGGKHPLVVSVNGAFHSDYGDGLVERVRRRLPGRRLVVITVVPVSNLDMVSPDGDDRKRADYLLYTLARTPRPATTPPGAGPSAGSSSSAR